MRRDLPRLRQSAARVSSDLAVALGPGWSCSVDEALVLTVHGPRGDESVLLDPKVEEFFEPGTTWTAEDRAAAWEQDADDVIASETLEILRVLGAVGPRCHQCDEPLDACSSVWTCPQGHDGPLIGDWAGRL